MVRLGLNNRKCFSYFCVESTLAQVRLSPQLQLPSIYTFHMQKGLYPCLLMCSSLWHSATRIDKQDLVQFQVNIGNQSTIQYLRLYNDYFLPTKPTA